MALEEKDSQQADALAVQEPQDGGLVAWLQVVGSFFIFFNIWGFISAFGVFQTFYQSNLSGVSDPSTISWVGSVESCLLILGGVLTGPIFDRGFFRMMLLAGSFLFVFGVMMLSLATEYYQILLAQGVCLGIASGMLYTPSLALVVKSFTKRRGLAIGLATSGSSVGGVVYPVMFRRLQPQVGFGWATRCMGFVALACFVASILIMLNHAPAAAPKPRTLFEPRALMEPAFALFTLGGFFLFLGLFVPFFYIPSFAESVVHAGADLSFYTLAVVNGSNFFGRISSGYVADLAGPMQTLMAAATTCGILVLSWIAVTSVAGLVVWAVIWGFFSAVVVSVPAAVLPLLAPSREVIGTRLGMAWAAAGVALLVGNPIAGALTTNQLAHFSHAQAFAGATLLVGVVCDFVPLAHIVRRQKQ